MVVENDVMAYIEGGWMMMRKVVSSCYAPRPMVEERMEKKEKKGEGEIISGRWLCNDVRG
jgi:hypothetical protein